MKYFESLESRRLFAAYVVDTLADTIAVDGFVSLREAITAANTDAPSGDAVAGDGSGADSISVAVSGVIVLSGTQLTVSDEIQIDGNGIIIDANGASRVMQTTGQVSLREMTLRNGSAANGGGLLVSLDTLLREVTVTGNVATSGGGGGIFVETGAAVLEIIDSTISNNLSLGTTGDQGGGIHSEDDTTVDITGSTITRNYATGAGGGIYAADGLRITNSTVSENATIGGAGGGGGGIYVGGAAVLTNAIVDGNSAMVSGVGGGFLSGGGGIMVAGRLRLIDSEITDNGVHNLLGQGGGIRVLTGGTLNVQATDVLRNSTNSRGGGVYVDDATLIFNESLIEQNSSATFGGGIDIAGDSAAVINETIIRGNAAVSNGGGIFSASSDILITRSEISFNFAGGNGGGLNVSGGQIYDSLIASNLALTNGGGVSGPAFFDGTTVRGNTAQNGDGGGVHIPFAINPSSDLSNSFIYHNRAGDQGGGIFTGADVSWISGNDVFGNTAISGGGIFSTADDAILLVDVFARQFHDNTPDNFAGFA